MINLEDLNRFSLENIKTSIKNLETYIDNEFRKRYIRGVEFELRLEGYEDIVIELVLEKYKRNGFIFNGGSSNDVLRNKYYKVDVSKVKNVGDYRSDLTISDSGKQVEKTSDIKEKVSSESVLDIIVEEIMG